MVPTLVSSGPGAWVREFGAPAPAYFSPFHVQKHTPFFNAAAQRAATHCLPTTTATDAMHPPPRRAAASCPAPGGGTRANEPPNRRSDAATTITTDGTADAATITTTDGTAITTADAAANQPTDATAVAATDEKEADAPTDDDKAGGNGWAVGPGHTHLNPRGRGVPPERKSHRFSWVSHRERLPMLI